MRWRSRHQLSRSCHVEQLALLKPYDHSKCIKGLATRQGESGLYRWRLEILPDAPAFAKTLPSPYRIYRLTASVSWGLGGTASTTVIKISR